MNRYAKFCLVCCGLGDVFAIGQLYTSTEFFTSLFRLIMAASVLTAAYLLWKSEQVKHQTGSTSGI
jgi:hypothetical protein